MRYAIAAVAALVLALVPVSAVIAAAPDDTIGGTLSVDPSGVTLRSDGTLPVAVTMTPSGPFTVSPASFTLAPGATQEMILTGEPAGLVSAHLEALTAGDGDTSSLTLEARFPEPAPPPGPPIVPILLALAALAAIILAARRLRVHELRLSRRETR